MEKEEEPVQNTEREVNDASNVEKEKEKEKVAEAGKKLVQDTEPRGVCAALPEGSSETNNINAASSIPTIFPETAEADVAEGLSSETTNEKLVQDTEVHESVPQPSVDEQLPETPASEANPMPPLDDLHAAAGGKRVSTSNQDLMTTPSSTQSSIPRKRARSSISKIDTSKLSNGIASPHHTDVLCGRGGGTNNFPGNSYFRHLVSQRKDIYLSSSKREKPKISCDIVNHIHSLEPPGRFLQKDSKTNLWYEIEDSRAREKTSQALREGAPVYKKNKEGGVKSPSGPHSGPSQTMGGGPNNNNNSHSMMNSVPPLPSIPPVNPNKNYPYGPANYMHSHSPHAPPPPPHHHHHHHQSQQQQQHLHPPPLGPNQHTMSFPPPPPPQQQQQRPPSQQLQPHPYPPAHPPQQHHHHHPSSQPTHPHSSHHHHHPPPPHHHHGGPMKNNHNSSHMPPQNNVNYNPTPPSNVSEL